jgi:hypothetical protein
VDPEVRWVVLRTHTKTLQVQIDDEIVARDACDRLDGKAYVIDIGRILCKLLKNKSHSADDGASPRC